MLAINEKISLAKSTACGGALRSAVMERLEWAARNNEEYTENQFNEWLSLLEDASGMVDDPFVASGIYRDIARLIEAKGDSDIAVTYYKKAIDIDPESIMCAEYHRQIKERENKKSPLL